MKLILTFDCTITDVDIQPFIDELETNPAILNVEKQHCGACSEKTDNLKKRTETIELLEKYTKFLQKHGYIDTDATSEEPYAIDEFLKTNQ
jgi:hypothetical protein